MVDCRSLTRTGLDIYILFLLGALTTTTPARALLRATDLHHQSPHRMPECFTNPLSFIFLWAAMSHNVSQPRNGTLNAFAFLAQMSVPLNEFY
jgi:hypothetical protein